MSRSAVIVFPWRPGEPPRRFRLALGEIVRLEEDLGRSVFALFAGVRTAAEILATLVEGSFPPLDLAPARLGEIEAVVRLGLVGGGLDEAEAARLVGEWMATADMARVALAADRILRAALLGAPDEPPGKDEGAAASEPTSSPPMDD